MGVSNFNRRSFLAMSGLAVCAMTTTGYAATPRDAEVLITQLTRDINKTIETR